MLPNLIQWTMRNKLLLFFIAVSFCLFVSTVTLSVQKRNLNKTIRNQQAMLNNISTSMLGAEMPDTLSKITGYYRLPRNVKPVNYRILLNPDMSQKTFTGNVVILIKVLEPTKVITLHSKNLVIHDVLLKNINNHKNIKITSTDLTGSDDRELLQVKLKDEIPVMDYELSISFSGRLDKGIVGFYASTLRNGDTMVASKFQPTYARQAFPCFDEPDFKATYNILLVKPPNYVALSNMHEVNKTIDQKTKMETVHFATSVPMSTYLVCFVICNFEYKEAIVYAKGIGRNFRLRSFAQKDQTHKIDFALDIGKRVTEYYIKYYEVPFPLPKLDMIAIPDYVSGATEHWGLITYRETSFLVDNETASSRNKISVANTIAHELAHMWFGNLVTMKWWDEVWLNEGFASYMQVKSLNAVEPEWSMLDQFLIKTMHPVLVTDAKLSSHPILQEVETPDQITAIFDAISYNKGASVLRMLEGMLGEEYFRRSISDYLKKYEYGNTETRDLLLFCMDPYFKIDNPIYINISYIIETWTRQMGYPVVTVTPGEDNTYTLTQARFLLDPLAQYENDSEFKYRWFIPITYRTNKGTSRKILWFPDAYENVKITLGPGEKLIKVNNNQVGFYRVNYPDEMWENLIDLLRAKSDKLTISDRAHLLNDVFALSEAARVSYDIALNLTSYLAVEKEYVPWEAAATILNQLSHRLLNSEAHDHLQQYVQRLIKPLYLEQTWEKTNLSVIQGLFRTRILSTAVTFELPEAKEKVRELFLRWLNARNTSEQFTIEPDLRDFVYYHGMKEATEADWEALWKIYLAEEDVQELAKLRNALSAPRNKDILKKFIQLAWDEKYIRSQDYLTVLDHISSNPSGTDLVWGEVRSNWRKLVDRFTLNSRYLGGLIPAITSSFNTEDKLKEMEEFFEMFPEAGAGKTARKRALETVKTNIKWSTLHKNNVSEWLKEEIEEGNLLPNN